MKQLGGKVVVVVGGRNMRPDAEVIDTGNDKPPGREQLREASCGITYIWLGS